jgi:hypothetical protein
MANRRDGVAPSLSPNGKEMSPNGKTRTGDVTDNEGATDVGPIPHNSSKGPPVSILQYDATQPSILIQHDAQDQRAELACSVTPGRLSVAVVTAALVVVPAVFWAALAWLVLGTLAAIIVAAVALVVTVFTMALVRSADELETPEAPIHHAELPHAA